MSRRVCITADDYGLRPENDAVIVELAASRRIDAVSVMVHEGASLEGLARVRASGVATGLHLVLVGERPLAPRAHGALLDRTGALPRSWAALAARLMLPGAARGLASEVEAQLDRYLALGLSLDFVNGHQHVHLFPSVWRALARELDRRGLAPWVRAPLLRPAPIKDVAVAIAARRARSIHALPGPRLVSFGLAHAGCQTPRAVEAAIAASAAAHLGPDMLAEIVFHPGAVPSTAAPRHRWGYDWEGEVALLRSDVVDRGLAARGLVRGGPAPP